MYIKSKTKIIVVVLSLFFSPLSFSMQSKTTLDIGDSKLTLFADLDAYELGKQSIIEWVQKSAQIVADYYGTFPVAEVGLVLDDYNGGGVRTGRAYGQPVLQIIVEIGSHVTQDQLAKDWILVHELIHLAFPDIPDRHHWFEEGLPTYIESIARVQAGDLEERFIWKGFMKGMPKGLPLADDQGLDNTPTWGRTYWGGALFCFVADMEIRKQTQFKMGLQDAMQAVLNSGLTLDKMATMDEVIEIADKKTGTTVLRDLYERMKDSPEPVNLNVMWDELGIIYNDKTGDVSINDNAPMSQIRKSILKRRS